MTPPLPRWATIVIVVAWALCPLVLAVEAYTYWRTGADLDLSGGKRAGRMFDTAFSVGVAYVLARSVEAIVWRLAARGGARLPPT